MDGRHMKSGFRKTAAIFVLAFSGLAFGGPKLSLEKLYSEKDNLFAPGEKIALKFSVYNSGDGASYGLMGKLVSADKNVTVEPGKVSFGSTLRAGSQVESTEATVKINTACPVPRRTPMILMLKDAKGRMKTLPCTLSIVKTCHISGKVTKDTLPLAETEVLCVPNRSNPAITQTGMTNASGMYSIEVTPGTYTLSLSSVPTNYSLTPVKITASASRSGINLKSIPIISVTPSDIRESLVQGMTRTVSLTKRNNTRVPIWTTNFINGGYSFALSTDNGGPAFVWEDIRKTGSEVYMSNAAAFRKLTFPFPFYGIPQSAVYISADGVLSFLTDEPYSIGYVSRDLPNGELSCGNMISATGKSYRKNTGKIYFKDFGDRAVIQYTNMIPYTGKTPDTATFQVVLDRRGNITVHYKNEKPVMPSSPEPFLVGIQNATSTDGLAIAFADVYNFEKPYSILDSFNMNFLKSGLSVRFIPTVQWASLATEMKYLSPGQTLATPLTVSSTNFAPGVYRKLVKVLSPEFKAIVPVALEVTLTSVFAGCTIGASGNGGSISTNGEQEIVSGYGSGIGGTSDQFFFAAQQLIGNGTIVARIRSMDSTLPGSKAGIMIRDNTTSPGAPNVMIGISPSSGIIAQSRVRTGTYVSSVTGSNAKWLKIEKTGNILKSSFSVDGVAWTVLDSAVLSYLTKPFIGFAVCSGDSSRPCKTVFDNVTITSAENSNLAPGGTATASSIQGNEYSAAKAIDGSTTTYWNSANLWDTQWLKVDLGMDKTVTGIRTTFRYPRTVGYKVEISTDGIFWKTMKDNAPAEIRDQVRTDRFNARCRFVRFTFTSIVEPVGNAGINELEVFGR